MVLTYLAKQYWNIAKKVYINKHCETIPALTKDNVIYTDAKDEANIPGQYFSSLSQAPNIQHDYELPVHTNFEQPHSPESPIWLWRVPIHVKCWSKMKLCKVRIGMNIVLVTFFVLRTSYMVIVCTNSCENWTKIELRLIREWNFLEGEF